MPFADDTKMYTTVNNVSECLKLQHEFDMLLSWSRKWKMTFTVNKCKALSLTLKKNPTVFQQSMNGEVLQSCSSIMDTGVLLDHKLTGTCTLKVL